MSKNNFEKWLVKEIFSYVDNHYNNKVEKLCALRTNIGPFTWKCRGYYKIKDGAVYFTPLNNTKPTEILINYNLFFLFHLTGYNMWI